jgi:nitric-oxide synthase
LGLKWHAVPVIFNMRLEIGGISYTAAPFNGWYMGTEVGARNLGDVKRYNLLPVIAQKMGLEMHSDRTLWKDRALIELNVAVLHSFAQQGVTMVDHHTASRQFVLHEDLEKQAGRTTPADWGWIVPPISGSTTPVFHTPYDNHILTPNLFYQDEPWREQKQLRCPLE